MGDWSNSNINFVFWRGVKSWGYQVLFRVKPLAGNMIAERHGILVLRTFTGEVPKRNRDDTHMGFAERFCALFTIMAL